MIRRIERVTKAQLRWFHVIERGQTGQAHIHALIWSPVPIPSAVVSTHWQMGLSQVRRYDSERGSRYLAKDLGSGRVESYDFSAALPPLRTGVSGGEGGAGENPISYASTHALLGYGGHHSGLKTPARASAETSGE
jgi:hypothetical protein